MESNELENEEGTSAAEYALGVTLTMNARTDVLPEFRLMKDAIIEWVSKRADSGVLIVVNVVAFGLTMQTSVRLAGALAAVWLTRWLYILYIVRAAQLSTPLRRLFRVAVIMHVASFVAFILCAAGLIGRVEPLYLCGVVLTITEVGWTFLVQFQSERS